MASLRHSAIWELVYRRSLIVRVLISCVFCIALITALPEGLAADEANGQVRLWPDNLFGVDFVDSSFGIISGYAGTILRTEDGGQSWQSIYIGVDELIRRISFVDTEYGWAIGHRGSILQTQNGGRDWSVQHSETNPYLRDIHFVDRDNGWVVGHDATILHTKDGGSTWSKESLIGFKGRDLPRLHGVFASNPNSAVLVGEFGVVAQTDDGGTTWYVHNSPTKKTLLDVAGKADSLVAVGLDGTAISISSAPQAADSITSNLTIESLETGTTEHFLAIALASDTGFIAAGRSVVVLISDKTVSHLMPDANIQLPFTWFGGVDVLDDGTFWLVGIRGTIARGDVTTRSFKEALALGRSDAISVLSNRWESAK